ncbi:hypothetical protein AVEN_110939-1 [Araneus ventricosus]|uniref:Retroviral polymerase SH3-like domain-containing protein n=1 Tax=Araneus ventricosus TaxID=182803 RepID=A0A4Y2HD79_ARAVE|nr:hypothetical protein AVEN_110939-1 [Araneus ventricosus]
MPSSQKIPSSKNCRRFEEKGQQEKSRPPISRKAFCSELSSLERTSVYTPEQNGVAGRFNRTAVEGIIMLQDSGLKPQFWAEALYTLKIDALINLQEIKLQLKFGLAIVHQLSIFVFSVHAYIPSVRRNKLQAKAYVEVMIGYGIKTRGYRVWVPKQRRVIETTRVSINEHKNGVKHLYGTPHTYESVDVLNSSENLLDIISETMQELENHPSWYDGCKLPLHSRV